jgi:hypothetical protein
VFSGVVHLMLLKMWRPRLCQCQACSSSWTKLCNLLAGCGGDRSSPREGAAALQAAGQVQLPVHAASRGAATSRETIPSLIFLSRKAPDPPSSLAPTSQQSPSHPRKAFVPDHAIGVPWGITGRIYLVFTACNHSVGVIHILESRVDVNTE